MAAIDWNIRLRPRTWDDIIGQSHIKNVIQQALAGDTFPRFSMFAGPSGMGKSAIAELCGLALACQVDKVNPCRECDNCQAFLKGQSRVIKKYNMAKMINKRDIIEVLDDIFEFESLEGQTIFILEEVHVLKDDQQSPFLEELTKIPEDVHIIMCTTQIWKLQPELRNRAVRFDLEMPTVSECEQYILKICRFMGIQAPGKETLRVIVENCENTPRKIVSTLQLFSTQSVLSPDVLSKFFGVANEEVYLEVLENLLPSKSFLEYSKFLETLADKSSSSVKIVKGFEKFLTTVLLTYSNPKRMKLLPHGKRLEETLAVLGEQGILKIFNSVATMESKAKYTESGAKFWLVKLKLLLTEGSTTILSNNASRATVTKLQSLDNSRTLVSKEEEGATEDLELVTLQQFQATGTVLFAEEDDEDE